MTRSKQWRTLLLGAFGIAAIIAIAACGGDDNASSTPTPGASASTSTDNRQQGGTLKVQSLEFQSLDPHYSNFFQDISIQRMLWRGLYTMDINNKPQPVMAAALPLISADGKTYTIKIRPGLKWSDGSPLIAKDFEAGLKRTCNPILAGTYESLIDTSIAGCSAFYSALGTAAAPATPTAAELKTLEDAVGAKATDDSTLVITLNQSQPTFTLILSLWLTFPVPTHLPQFTAETPDKPAAWGTDPSKLAYNGPYILKTYTAQSSAILIPNPNFAGAVKPTLNELDINFIEKNDVADNAYRTGELDEAYADLANLQAVQTEFGAEFFKAAQPGTRGLLYNLAKPPLDNLQVRLAMSQAIDRQKLIDVTAGGAYQETTSWLPKFVDGEDPDFFAADIGFDATKAVANLTAAGYPNGAGFPKLKILARDTAEAQAQAAFIQNSFKTVLNIDVDIQTADSPTRSAALNSHNFDLAVRSGWIQDYPDPENWILSLFQTGASNNFQSCSNPDIDALIAKAQYNTNETERLSQYNQINKLIVTTLCGYAPIYHEANNWLIKPTVVGMRESSAAQNAVLPGDWNAEAWGLKK